MTLIKSNSLTVRIDRAIYLLLAVMVIAFQVPKIRVLKVKALRDYFKRLTMFLSLDSGFAQFGVLLILTLRLSFSLKV